MEFRVEIRPNRIGGGTHAFRVDWLPRRDLRTRRRVLPPADGPGQAHHLAGSSAGPPSPPSPWASGCTGPRPGPWYLCWPAWRRSSSATTSTASAAMCCTAGRPFPSYVDLVYLACTRCSSRVCVLLVRKRTPTAATGRSVIDAGIITVGVGLVSWVFSDRSVLPQRATSGSCRAARVHRLPARRRRRCSPIAVRLAVGSGRRPLGLLAARRQHRAAPRRRRACTAT